MSLINQKGIVSYQGRDDLVCNYGIRNDGKQFYYLDVNGGKPLKNGNRIATTALVEAVDPMVKASNIGLIDAEGAEVIPFTNRSIRPVNDDIIIVEPATPTSQSVKEAIRLKSDPLAATKLVATPATIKDKLNAKVGNDARYLFNDQFSEATVCDINGNNLVDGESYSFIVFNGNELYFSKNTVDSDITSYSVLPPEVQSDVTSNNAGEVIDVSDVNIPQSVVEDALNGEDQVESVATDSVVAPVDGQSSVATASSVEETLDENEVEAIDEAVSDEEVVTEPKTDAVPTEEPVSETKTDQLPEEDTVATAIEEAAVVPPIEDVVQENPVDDNSQDDSFDILGQTVSDEISSSSSNSAIEDNLSASDAVSAPVVPEDNQSENIFDTNITSEAADTVPAKDEVALNENVINNDTVSQEDVNLGDTFADTDFVDDETVDVSPVSSLEDFYSNNDEDKFDLASETYEDTSTNMFDTDINDSFEDIVLDDGIANAGMDYGYSKYDMSSISHSDNIMADVAHSMTSMIERIHDLQNDLANERNKCNKLQSAGRVLVDKNHLLVEQVDSYKNKISSLDAKVAQLSSKNSVLESHVHELKKANSAQKRELDLLRPLLSGRDEVVGILADAHALLGEGSKAR